MLHFIAQVGIFLKGIGHHWAPLVKFLPRFPALKSNSPRGDATIPGIATLYCTSGDFARRRGRKWNR